MTRKTGVRAAAVPALMIAILVTGCTAAVSPPEGSAKIVSAAPAKSSTSKTIVSNSPAPVSSLPTTVPTPITSSPALPVPTVDPIAEADPGSAWSKILADVEPNGKMTPATALAAFDLAIGPVPGVVIPSGSRPVVMSGTIALDAVLSDWSSLSAAQQSAVSADLGGVQANPAGPSTKSAPTSNGAGSPVRPAVQPGPSNPSPPIIDCPTANSPDAGPYLAQIPGIEHQIARAVGLANAFPNPVVVVVEKSPYGTALMYTEGCRDTPATKATSGSPGDDATQTRCAIHVLPRILGPSFSSADVHDALIHEMTHCLYDQQFGSAADSFPPWYEEGTACWVALTLGSSDKVATIVWNQYLTTPTRSLFNRTNDALGFFVHLAETGTDVWSRILPIGAALVVSGDLDQAGWEAAQPTGSFLNSWGSGFAQGRYPGTPWQTVAPRLPTAPLVALPTPWPVTNGSSAPFAALFPASAEIQPIDISADTVEVTVPAGTSGRLSLGNGKDITLAAANGKFYCAGRSCRCPGSATDLPTISPGLEYLTFTGGLTKGRATVVGASLADACAPICPTGTWSGPVTFSQVAGTGVGSASGAATQTSGSGNLTLVLGDDGRTATGTWTLNLAAHGTFSNTQSGTSVGTLAAAITGEVSGSGSRPTLNAKVDLTGTVTVEVDGHTLDVPIDLQTTDQENLDLKTKNCQTITASFIPSLNDNHLGYTTFTGVAQWTGRRR